MSHRELFRPKFPECAQQCPSCPFRVGNDAEFGEVIRKLRHALGMNEKVTPADIRHARLHIRFDAAHGDFICHLSAYTPEMSSRPQAEWRQCKGATEAYRKS